MFLNQDRELTNNGGIRGKFTKVNRVSLFIFLDRYYSSFFGQGLNLENLSFTKIGPLLILMGFLATTLSICDPIGAIQRSIIKGRKLRYSHDKTASDNYLSYNIFGKWIFCDLSFPLLFCRRFFSLRCNETL